MKHNKNDLIDYRFNRAKESLEEAKVLAQLNHWNTVANRLYYSAFYSINSLFIKYNLNATTHNGVKSQFHNEFIKNGLISKDFGKLYNDLFNKRQEGDYEDFQVFDKDTIEPIIAQVEEFLLTIEKLIHK